jgi:hypothetical protein
MHTSLTFRLARDNDNADIFASLPLQTYMVGHAQQLPTSTRSRALVSLLTSAAGHVYVCCLSFVPRWYLFAE